MNESLPTLSNMAIEPVINVEGLVKRTKLIHEVMEKVMQSDVHYGVIPGCEKPSLYQPGAQVLRQTFGLSMVPEVDIRELGQGHREYIARAIIRNSYGHIVGEGRGSCCTLEKKYRYRNADRICPDCKKSGTLKKSKQEGQGFYCWAKIGGCGSTFDANDPAVIGQVLGQIDNPDIADQYNTCLKMAVKRADVGGTISVTGASALFTQDVEDLPDYARSSSPPFEPPYEDARAKVIIADKLPPRPTKLFHYLIDTVPPEKLPAAKMLLERAGAEAVNDFGMYASPRRIAKLDAYELKDEGDQIEEGNHNENHHNI